MFQKLKLTYKPVKKESDNSGHQLAKDCVDELGGNFLFYRSVISKVGEDLVREWLSSVKHADSKYNKTALFMAEWKKFWNGIIWS